MLNNLDQLRRPTSEDGRNAVQDATKSRPTMWFLSGPLASAAQVRHVAIHGPSFLVGRRSDVALRLPNETVSSVHAVLLDSGLTLVLRDLDSTNGTYVNGRRITAPVELQADDLVHFADVAFRVLRQSGSASTATVCEDVCDQALALVQFDRLMTEEAVIPHYQPIVDINSGEILAYEVLARSRVPGLETPAAMFSAAAQLNLETRLSQIMRWKSVQETMTIPEPPHLFLNTHPAELREPGLIESMEALRDLQPRQPITLEIHEAALPNLDSMKELRKRLRELGVGLAFDDFGAGQARLLELAEVHPDCLKFDICLIRAVDQASAERVQMLTTLVNMVADMGVVPLAEGIEQEGEHEACRRLGFQLAQGFYFGKPFPLRTVTP